MTTAKERTMFSPVSAFGGFSVDDVDKAKEFYGTTLGLDVEVDGPMNILTITLPGGSRVIAYPKGDAHEPATFTILNFVVEDIDAAVDDLNTRGVRTKLYGDEPGVPPTDERGIARGSAETGPDIAWFADPAGNILSVLVDA